jgi:hypothetical protein
MKTLFLLFSVIFVNSCDKHANTETNSILAVSDIVSSIPTGTKPRVSEVLTGLGLLSRWDSQLEDNILLDSEGSFGRYSRTYSFSKISIENCDYIKLLGVGNIEEVAGGNYFVNEIKIGRSGHFEKTFIWNDTRYIYKDEVSFHN